MKRAYLYSALIICFLLTECSSTRSRRYNRKAQPRQEVVWVSDARQPTSPDSPPDDADNTIAENTPPADLHRDDGGYYLPPVDHSQFDYYEKSESEPSDPDSDTTDQEKEPADQEKEPANYNQNDSWNHDSLERPLETDANASSVITTPAAEIDEQPSPQTQKDDEITPYYQPAEPDQSVESNFNEFQMNGEGAEEQKHLQDLRETQAEFNQSHPSTQTYEIDIQSNTPSTEDLTPSSYEDRSEPWLAQPKVEKAPVDIPYEPTIQTWMTHEEPPATTAANPMIMSNGHHYCPKAFDEAQAAIERNCCTDATIISWMGDDEPAHEAHVETWMNDQQTTAECIVEDEEVYPAADPAFLTQTRVDDSERQFYPQNPWVVLDYEVEERVPRRSKANWLNDEEVFYAEAPVSTWERNDIMYTPEQYAEIMCGLNPVSYCNDDRCEFTWEQECDYAVSVEYIPRYKYTRKTRMIPEYYDVTTCKYVKQKTGPCTCRYVPKYETITRCRMVPELYYTCDVYYIPKYSKERRYRYVPTCYEKVDEPKNKHGKHKRPERSSIIMGDREANQKMYDLRRENAREMKYGGTSHSH